MELVGKVEQTIFRVWEPGPGVEYTVSTVVTVTVAVRSIRAIALHTTPRFSVELKLNERARNLPFFRKPEVEFSHFE